MANDGRVNTADLCDTYSAEIRVCTETFESYGARRAFHGPIETVKVFEDNVLVKQAIETVPSGTVLVVDGGASRRCALVGGNLAATAARRGLAGIIVYGCIRDAAEIRRLDIGVLALGTCPIKSRKEGVGVQGEVLRFGGIEWRPGAYVYVDDDGVVMAPRWLGPRDTTRTEHLSTGLNISPPACAEDHQWLHSLWTEEWGGDVMVSRGRAWHLDELACLVARLHGERVGAATYRVDDDGSCELVSINVRAPGRGIGTALLHAVEERARAAGCGRIWLITSNDNLDALRFYQLRGYRIVAVHPGAVDEARRIKPSIPVVGEHGIEVRDEIELAKAL